jgi:hypothetical protein
VAQGTGPYPSSFHLPLASSGHTSLT